MKRKLTFEYISQKTRCENPLSIKNLNVWGCDLEDVSVVMEMPNLEVVSLSVNQISSLKDFSKLFNLKELYLRKNNISDFKEIFYLKNLEKLRVLWLLENPLDQEKNYRLIIINVLPQLNKLDDSLITHEERLESNKIYLNREKRTPLKMNNNDRNNYRDVETFAKENNIEMDKYFPKINNYEKSSDNRGRLNNKNDVDNHKKINDTYQINSILKNGLKCNEENTYLPDIKKDINYVKNPLRNENINHFNLNGNNLSDLNPLHSNNENILGGKTNINYNLNNKNVYNNINQRINLNDFNDNESTNKNYKKSPLQNPNKSELNKDYPEINSNCSSTVFKCVLMLINELNENDLEIIKNEIGKRLKF